MKIDLDNYGLKTKLFGLLIVLLGFLTILVGVAAFNFSQIEATNSLKANISQIAQKILDTQASEKSGKSLSVEEMRRQSAQSFQKANQELESLGTAGTEIRQEFAEYQTLFGKLTSARAENQALKRNLENAISKSIQHLDAIVEELTEIQFDLQLEGDDLNPIQSQLFITRRANVKSSSSASKA